MLPTPGCKPSWPRLAVDFVRTPRFSPRDMTDKSRSVLAFNLSYLFDRKELLHQAMDQLVGWFDSGAIVAPPVKTYPLADVARAHADIESGTTIGKLVFIP